MYNSHSSATLDEQSASFPGNEVNSIPLFLVVSLAFLAAIRALAANVTLAIINFAARGFSIKYLSNCSPKIDETIDLTSLLPNLPFVCPSYCGSGCLTEITAVNPSLTSS